MNSVQYKLLGVDVRKEKVLEEVLHKAGLHWDCPTLILSEVVLTYMETQRYVPIVCFVHVHFNRNFQYA